MARFFERSSLESGVGPTHAFLCGMTLAKVNSFGHMKKSSLAAHEAINACIVACAKPGLSPGQS